MCDVKSMRGRGDGWGRPRRASIPVETFCPPSSRLVVAGVWNTTGEARVREIVRHIYVYTVYSIYSGVYSSVYLGP